jgi:hypothetical protein
MKAGCQCVGRTVRTRVGFFAALFFTLAGLLQSGIAQAATSSDSSTESAVTVLVFNFRNLPAETLIPAENEAGRILQGAGLQVTWRDCPTGNEPCRIGPGRVLFLSMSAGPVQNKFVETVSGYALLHDRIAVVYYDYLPRMPLGQDNEHDKALLLGSVITHELGHLLLGAHTHSTSGIMQAEWGVQQVQSALMSQLSFLPEEVHLIRSGPVTSEAANTSSIALTSH